MPMAIYANISNAINILNTVKGLYTYTSGLSTLKVVKFIEEFNLATLENELLHPFLYGNLNAKINVNTISELKHKSIFMISTTTFVFHHIFLELILVRI
jgi:hypothetical protein